MSRTRIPLGGLFISNDVITSIALNAAKETEGFAALAKRAKAALRPRSKAPIIISKGETGLSIDMNVKLKSDAPVQSTIKTIQQNVKTAVQNMTASVVKSVNVTVDDMVFSD